MNSLILQTTTRYLMPLLLLFSIFLFGRGHNEPGGGFVAGLVAAAPFALYSIAYGAPAARRVLRLDPRGFIGLGLLLIVLAGLLGAGSGQPFLSGLWGYVPVPGLGAVDLGTPVLFDLGVYLGVFGVTLTIILAMEEAD
ncbi:MAG TPA: Na+/H+ antiporter subunit B [Anaerolineales bacterium]|nr:Na+/H+ antiporter subunit B [Anaerolineales bacterium]HRF50672.1 Na+/H+ antiporter subunit B [Anaerolineales bacterium]